MLSENADSGQDYRQKKTCHKDAGLTKTAHGKVDRTRISLDDWLRVAAANHFLSKAVRLPWRVIPRLRILVNDNQ